MTWVCGHYLAGLAGSSSAGGMEICILWVLSGKYLCLRRITWPEESSVACLSVTAKPRQWGGPGPLEAVAPPWTNKAKKQNSLCASVGRALCIHNRKWTNSCTHFNSSPDGSEWSQHDLSAILPVMRSPCSSTPTQPHRNSDTHRTKNNTTNVVMQQNSRKLLMMDILMSETCWAHKKLNKIASDIKLVFYSSAITVMHGPINIRITILVQVEETANNHDSGVELW